MEKTKQPINKVEIERVYAASLEKVWQAWTDPKMLMQWWGPYEVTIPECEIDLRVGGKFHIVMEAGAGMGPYAGTKWPMLAEFTVVQPEAKISYKAQGWTEGEKEQTMIDQTTDIFFSAENEKTKLKIIAEIQKAGPNPQMAVQGMQAGFTQQLEKLAKFLAA